MSDSRDSSRALIVCIKPFPGSPDPTPKIAAAVQRFGKGAPLFLPEPRAESVFKQFLLSAPHVWYVYTRSRDELQREFPQGQLFVAEVRPHDPDQPDAFAWANPDPRAMDQLGRAAYAFDEESFPGSPGAPSTPE